MRLYKDTLNHTVHYSFSFIMSLAIALSLLAQGNTGSDLLQILDSIVEEVSEV